MSDKYIIRNCPICEHCDWDNGYGELEEGYICKRITIDSFECKDIEKCLLKRIVEKCKLFQNNYLVNDGVQLLTTNILNSLDIQEVE